MASFGRALKDRVLGIFGVKNSAYTNTIGIGGTSQPTDNSATWNYGFPSRTMTPVDTSNPTGGGIPPNGKDFNGVLNSISAECYNAMNGILPSEWISPNVWTSVDSTWDGYPVGAIVIYPAGSTSTPKKLYQSVSANNLDTPSLSYKWVELFKAPTLTIYPAAQNINGNTNCWIREYPDGFIMQGGTLVGNIALGNAKVNLIKPYQHIQMGATATSVSAVTRNGDNDPAAEVGYFSMSLYNPDKMSDTHSEAFVPMHLDVSSFRTFRRSGGNSDPVTVIWTSWGV